MSSEMKSSNEASDRDRKFIQCISSLQFMDGKDLGSDQIGGLISFAKRSKFDKLVEFGENEMGLVLLDAGLLADTLIHEYSTPESSTNLSNPSYSRSKTSSRTPTSAPLTGKYVKIPAVVPEDEKHNDRSEKSETTKSSVTDSRYQAAQAGRDAAEHQMAQNDANEKQQTHLDEMQKIRKALEKYSWTLAGWFGSCAYASYKDGVNSAYWPISLGVFCLLLLFWVLSGLPLLFYSPLGSSSGRCRSDCCSNSHCMRWLNKRDKFKNRVRLCKTVIGRLLDVSAVVVPEFDWEVSVVVGAVSLGISLAILLFLLVWNGYFCYKLGIVMAHKQKQPARIQPQKSKALMDDRDDVSRTNSVYKNGITDGRTPIIDRLAQEIGDGDTGNGFGLHDVPQPNTNVSNTVDEEKQAPDGHTIIAKGKDTRAVKDTGTE